MKGNLSLLAFLLMLSVSCSRGKCIEGDCENGKGTFLRSDGAVYTGYWKNSRREGFGEEESKESHYIGYYKDNQYDGEGKRKWKTTNMIFEGTFRKGDLHGKGKKTFSDGTIRIGQFIDGKSNGYAETRQKNGDVFKGQWRNDRRYGYGTLTFGDRKRKPRSGKWHNDSYCEEGNCVNGYGKAILPNGYLYEGFMQEGWPSGKGLLQDKNGKLVFEGEFKIGDPIRINEGEKTNENTN